MVKKLTMTQKLVKLKKKKIVHEHGKYITTQEFNKLTAENFAARLKQTNLANKADIDDFVEKLLELFVYLSYLYISYTLDPWSRALNTDFTLGDCLFGTAKLTKNPDPNKYGYSGYGTGFDARSEFSLPDGNWGKNVIIFGVDNSSSVHDDHKKKDILVLGEGPTQ